MAETEISAELIQKAMQNVGIPPRLQEVANRIKSRGESLASAEGVEMKITTVAGVRPKGRPFVNVIGDNEEQEFGSSRSAKYRILGRAGEGA